jgi:hypothetical protein
MPTTEPVTEADLEVLESLEQEREFLLRSLADLDDEYEAGDIEDHDYRSLTDDYTARAAAVLRAIEAIKVPKSRGGKAAATRGAPRTTAVPRSRRPAPSPPPVSKTIEREREGGNSQPHADADPQAGSDGDADTEAGADSEADEYGSGSQPGERRAQGRTQAVRSAESAQLAAALRSRRRWRTVAVVVVIAAFGGIAAWAVSQSSGSRLPGQTATGNGQLAGNTGTTVAGGIDPRIQTALNDVNQGQVADALKLFDAVLKDDPNQPVALADGGWLQAQAGLAGNRPDLVDAGLAQIEKAEQVDSSFADAHFFRGFLLLRAKNDAPGAVTELRTYLGMVDPSSPQVASVQALLQEAIKAAGPNVPAGPNAPATTIPITGSSGGTPTTSKP